MEKFKKKDKLLQSVTTPERGVDGLHIKEECQEVLAMSA